MFRTQDIQTDKVKKFAKVIFKVFNKVNECFNKYLIVMLVNEIQFMTDESFADPKSSAYRFISTFDEYMIRPSNGTKLLMFLKHMKNTMKSINLMYVYIVYMILD